MTERKEVKVLKTIDDIGKENVDSISEDGFFTYGYFKTLEKAKPYNIVLFYLAVYDGGNVIAVVPCYVDLDDRFYGLDGRLPFSGSIAGVASRMGFCLNRLVVCYSPNSYHSKIFIKEGYDGKMVLDLLSRKVDGLCRKKKILFSSFPFVPESEKLLTNNLGHFGYVSFPAVDTFCLDVCWSDFDDYVNSLETRKRRQTVRRQMRKCVENRLTITEETDFGGFSSTLSSLHSNLFSKHNKGCKSPYKASFFSELDKHARDVTKVFTVRKEGRIVGFSLLLQQGNTLDGYLVGFDYDARMNNDFAYFNVAYYEPIRMAIQEGFRKIHFSINAAEEKLQRGCRLEKTFSFVKCHNAFVGSLYTSYMRIRKG